MKKKLFAVFILFLLICISVIIILKSLPDKTLTVEQKLEDFDYLYHTLVEHQPMLDEYKEVMGFDFEGNRDFYRQLIANTKDDYEFFVIMDMIMEDFPSCHTSLHNVSQGEVLQFNYDFSPQVTKSLPGRDKKEYWNDFYMKYLLEENGQTSFVYHGGLYISTGCNFAEDLSQTLILLAIDDEPIDEYVCRTEVNGRLSYDNYNNKIYRHAIELNLSYGTVVSATFQNIEGEVFEREVCIRNKDCAFEMTGIAPVKLPEVSPLVLEEVHEDGIEVIQMNGPCNIAIDHNRNLSYIYMGSLGEIDNTLFSNAMEKACEKDNIILDFRINEGGYREIFLECIYPYLFKEDVSGKGISYISKKTSQQKSMAIPFCYLLGLKVDKEKSNKENLGLEFSYYAKGNGKIDKNVYLLTSYNTYSAADWASHIMKEHTETVLIGCATGGEGLSWTACIDIMPNSRLMFLFQHNQAFNPDGTSNGVYGTLPDIYIESSVESIAKRNQLLATGIMYNSYVSRLKWDNVLLETIRMIE